MKRTLHPLTLRRLRRFRRARTAWISFWILTVLYVLSLGAELFCNDRPLLLRFEDRWYVPFLRFYPEDEFLGNDRFTRPDYKQLRDHEVFAHDDGNWMLFPLIPNGPREILTPDRLRLPDEVQVRIEPRARVASVYVDAGLQALRWTGYEDLSGNESSDPGRAPLPSLFELPAGLHEAVAQRMRNEAADEWSGNGALNGTPIRFYLTDYTPRTRAPSRVRIRMEAEPDAARDIAQFRFDRDKEEPTDGGRDWAALEPEQRETVRQLAAKRFQHYIEPVFVRWHDRPHRVVVTKPEVRFPLRPIPGHPMGIDSAGRDVLARLIYGFRVSMTFGIILVLASMSVGITVGSIQGYYAGTVDIVGQRVIEIWQALPFLYVLILLGSIYGQSFVLLLICYGVFNWIGISYYVRAEFLNLRKRPFVEAAQCLGLSHGRIMRRHILPNALTSVITFFPFSLVGAIGILAALDFLGFGLPPPTASWGEMLSQAQEQIWAWWLIVYPTLALFMVCMLTVFIGEGVRSALDPRPFVEWE